MKTKEEKAEERERERLQWFGVSQKAYKWFFPSRIDQPWENTGLANFRNGAIHTNSFKEDIRNTTSVNVFWDFDCYRESMNFRLRNRRRGVF